MNTKYRIVNDGYFDYLQYEKEYKFLGLFKKKKWCYVPDCFHGLERCFSYNCYVSSANHDKIGDLEEYARRWPDINEYLKHYEKCEKELLLSKEEKHMERQEKAKKIKYL